MMSRIYTYISPQCAVNVYTILSPGVPYYLNAHHIFITTKHFTKNNPNIFIKTLLYVALLVMGIQGLEPRTRRL